MTQLIIDSDDMLRMQNHFNYLAMYMVAEEMAEARRRSASYAAAGGRRRDPSLRYRGKFGPRRLGARVTGAMIAWMAEKCFYRRFIDFWKI